MKLLRIFNFIAGLVAVAGIIAGLIIQFQNRSLLGRANSAVTYYFKTTFSTISYAEVQSDYVGVANRIKAQLENALNEESSNRNNNEQTSKRQKREACCPGATVTILGIADDNHGGVVVMSGIAYAANMDPTLNTLKEKVNEIPGANVEKAIDSQEPNSDTSSGQICSPANCIPDVRTTIFTTPAACPPCPTASKCPSSPPPSVQPAIPVGLPCMVDIGILLDSSTAVSQADYRKMLSFVREKLVPLWTIGPQSTEVAVAVYDKQSVKWDDNRFTYANNTQLENALGRFSSKQQSGTPSIQSALASMKTNAKNRRKNSKLVTVLFTYTSDGSDIEAAQSDAQALSQNDDTILTVGIGNDVDMHLLSTLNAFTIKVEEFDEKSAIEISSALCIGKPSQFQPTPAPTGHPQLPCEIDIGVYLDRSTAVTEQEYKEEVQFLQEKLASRWYVMPSWTDVSIGAYGADGGPWFGGFWYHYDEDFRRDLKNMSSIAPLGPPSLTVGFNATKWLIDNRQRFGHVAAYILFTYTSDEADLKQAKPYADYVKSTAGQLIVVGVGSQFNSNNIKTILDIEPFIATQFDDGLADKILTQACVGSPTAPTEKPKPGLGCDYDVLLMMDLSSAVPAKTYQSEVQFLKEILVPTWNINPWATETAVGTFQGGMASFGDYAFRYANAEKFYEMLSLYSSESPSGRTDIVFGMQSIISEIKYNRRKGKKVATVVFLYDAKPEDVDKAVPFADEIVTNGDRLIIVCPGAANAKLFEKLSTEVLQVQNLNEEAAHLVNTAICTPQPTRPIPNTSTTHSTPQSTIPNTSTTHSLPQPTPKSDLECDYDVLLMMDLSSIVPAKTYQSEIQFIKQHLVPTWNISPSATEVEVGTFEGGTASFGWLPFNYANAEKFNEVLSLFIRYSPHGKTDIVFGMQVIKSEIEEYRRKGKKVATVVFLYDAKPEDVDKAVPFADEIVTNGDRLIIVCPGAANAKLFGKLSTKILQVENLDNEAAHLVNTAICTPQPTRPIPNTSTTHSTPQSTRPVSTPTTKLYSTANLEHRNELPREAVVIP